MTSSTFTLDTSTVQQMVENAVEENILSVIESLLQDPAWLEKIERMINQAVVQRTVAKISSTDINSVIHEHVNKQLPSVHEKFVKNFSTNGIKDLATSTQFTVMDEATVIENQLVAHDLQIVGNTQVKDLTVTGSINTDNQSWNNLAQEISRRTLDQIDQSWHDKLTEQVAKKIQSQGISFESVNIGDHPLVSDHTLSNHITRSNLQSLGHLDNLQVKGEAHVGNTLSVVNRRIGINTASPESALSIWDEEVSVIIGKYQSKQAYVGTSRDQALVLGTNRSVQVEIEPSGLTKIKRVQIGLHKISHDVQVPGWSGTRGDIVFNSNPGPDRVFAWVCLGSHKWQTVKSAE